MTHRPTLELIGAVSPEVAAGARVILRLRAVCPEGCELGGGSLSITGPLGVVHALALADGEATEVVLTAPEELGEAAWSMVLPAGESAGVRHEEVSVTLNTSVVPHATSVAVWDVPSPLEGTTFTVKVGVTCSLGCPLAHRRVEVRDEMGAKLAEGRLGERLTAGTAALYEADIELVAPARMGVFTRRVVFDATALGLPHVDATADFTFRVLAPPEHTVAVKVMWSEEDAPKAGVEVRVGAYRAYTDENGVAKVGVPKGTHEVSIWRIDLEFWSTSLEVRGDATVEVQAAPRRPLDEDAERIWM